VHHIGQRSILLDEIQINCSKFIQIVAQISRQGDGFQKKLPVR
jgi:hypothetical protein